MFCWQSALSAGLLIGQSAKGYLQHFGDDDSIALSTYRHDVLSEKYLPSRPLVVLRDLFVGWVSKSGDLHYLDSISDWHCNRLRAFTDAKDDKYVKTVMFDGKYFHTFPIIVHD
jgi:hypothetical protein